MQNLLRRLSVAFLAGLAGLAQADTPKALQPLAFLAGHCWKADMPIPQQTDEHCFSWLYGGKYLRDAHLVRTPGKPDYAGESTYYVDAASGLAEYLYIENKGNASRGQLAPGGGDVLQFAPSKHSLAGGKILWVRANWRRVGEHAYEALTESRMDEVAEWKTMFKVVYRRSGS